MEASDQFTSPSQPVFTGIYSAIKHDDNGSTMCSVMYAGCTLDDRHCILDETNEPHLAIRVWDKDKPNEILFTFMSG